MLQAFIAKRVINVVLKKIMRAREIKKMRKYVEEENELDIQIKFHAKALDKYGKIIEELEKEVAILKKDSHPPIFTLKDKNGINKRLKKLEKGE